MNKIEEIKNIIYDIKGNNKGFYIKYNLTLMPSELQELEKYLRLNDNVLKFINVKVED